ncbi:YbaB/EbfC family nucleoid-associated protein [Saccharopolyspora sp. 6M]|uniref:YbaB/EbfC family nucleoid-associated protein n=1 Tax=Saccharopolyspora sp. 6M TaxID=2877237 RepID=UPI001CD3EF9D|nr:YbaB/EbfC family nucleoid-associated protein [Saccharopolyspora sp. 6M]MCA1229316.1 YbaB/EbfC family nucleoid-associated protein [Saccharopolyspora sp. 6M]
MSGPAGFAALGSDPDDPERRIEDWVTGVEEKARRYEAVREETEQIRLTATGPDGRVKVTVRADGGLTGTEFSEKIRSMPLDELSAQILGTIRKAQGDIASRVGEVMSEQLGDEDRQTRSLMLDNLRDRVPEEPDEPEAEAPGSATWAAPEDDEPQQRPGPTPPSPPGSGSPGSSATRPTGQRRPRRPDDDEDFPLRGERAADAVTRPPPAPCPS